MVRSFVWAIFTHFGILKMRFPTIRETNVSKVPRKECGNFFIFEAWKCEYVQSKSAFQGCQALCKQIFRILVNWKCVFCRFVKPMFVGTLLRVRKFFRVANPRFMSTLACVKIVSVFWRSVNAICVYWRELDGLFMETGLLLRKLDGLLKENWCSLDGTRTVYWRKLDGVNTETG